jgi:SAM-dependent methyltransferase
VTVEAAAEAIWHDVECGSYAADLPLWRALVARAAKRRRPCEVLDLGCGTGRVSLALAGPSCNVTGLDADPQLAAELRERARARGAPVEVVVADASAFDLARTFDLALAPMQLVQLLEGRARRQAMFERVAAHLEPGRTFALALLDPEESWDASDGPLPAPDETEVDGWVFASQPVAVKRRARALELERVRRAIAPTGERSDSLSRVRLELVEPDAIEREAAGTGFTAEARRRIAPTEMHVGSTVVVLRRGG